MNPMPSQSTISSLLTTADSDLRDCSFRLAGIAAAVARLAAGPSRHAPRYKSRADELAVNFAALRNVQRDLTAVTIRLRPLIET